MNYGTAASFVDYQTQRDRTIPGTWDDAAITAALLVASEWIDNTYGPSFTGYKTGGYLQEREWPRINAVVTCTIPPYVFQDSDIPLRVEQATYEAAYRQLTSPGSLQIDYAPAKYRSVSVTGAITVQYQTFNTAAEIQTQILAVDTLLAPLIDPYSDGAASSLSGATRR